MTTPTQQNWMIYGANGYTGELIAREAVKRGYKPTLAGRTLSKIQPLAQELGLTAVGFALEDQANAAQHIKGHHVVMHCAGPFSATAEPMMKACMAAKAHYLDITGEIAVFELAQSLHAQAQAAGTVICSGVGFDVIPTDCVAASLKAALPDATHLVLGFDSKSGPSAGTAKTSLEGFIQGGKARINGKITSVPMAHNVRHIDFGGGMKKAMTIPWGDVSTAFHSTGIPNIEVYIPANSSMIFGAKSAKFFRGILAKPSVQDWLKKRIDKTIKGPDESLRSTQPTYVWGEARNAKGDIKTARVQTENVYSLTITGALAVIEHLLQNHATGGTYTPSKLVGADLVTRLPGSSKMIITSGQ